MSVDLLQERIASTLPGKDFELLKAAHEVGDEKNSRFTMSRVLESLEVPVETAVNGKEVLKKLREPLSALGSVLGRTKLNPHLVRDFGQRRPVLGLNGAFWRSKTAF